jgi:hypothetical protein
MGPPPEMLTIATGGGGLHLIFRYPDGKLKPKLSNGIDLKADDALLQALVPEGVDELRVNVGQRHFAEEGRQVPSRARAA